ncbi:MAG: hypothetical protein ACRCT7_13465 [Shewanella sp.]|uniref:hypothetical protein n=1 Tax=Shewanella sp. SNU WT4 TaxID=2590015 RepID=UPI00112A40EB|nr:hypothetical protein [Shewanella sp. SNU WT4]QDF66758.1 hypothetical protein FJQ87_08545 [Shewanella sp. SNU WT4]
MIITVVLVLIGALVLVVIGINIIQQQKARVEGDRRNEFNRQKAILDETEAVLANSAILPCSNQIIIILHERIKDALQSALTSAIPPISSQLEKRLVDVNNMLEQLRKNADNTPSIESFRLPDNDKQILLLVQSLKKLKAILRNENTKGKVVPEIFSQEEKRIDSLQLRINVDAMLNRAKSACAIKQYGSAKQLVTKAIATLNALKQHNPTDPFVLKKSDEAKDLLEEMTGAQQTEQPNANQAQKPGDELDMLFQPKKKW